MIGWDGYFGNRLSLPEFLNSKKPDPLPDTISLEWTHYLRPILSQSEFYIARLEG
jgi:hypothetical protein